MAGVRWVRSFDGTALYTSWEGSGPTLVLCDGLGCDGFIWKYLREQLSPRYRLVFWNYRGHGQSHPPAHPDAIGVSALRADLQAVLDAYDIDRAVVLGHSMGAQIALDFTLTYPERVHGVVSLCGTYGKPLDTLHGSKRLGRMFPLLRASLMQFPEAGERLWQWVFQNDWSFAYARRFETNEKRLIPADFRPYFEHLAGMDPQVFFALTERLQKHSVLERLGELRRPALVIAGENDTFCPAVLSERMHRAIAGSKLLVVPGGSHVAPLENPQLVFEALSAFLYQNVPRNHA